MSVERLQAKWVDGATTIYIGKAGKLPSGRPTLRTRIRQYLEFGQGKPVGHWGGRYIWQLKDAQELLFCWKPTPDEEPRAVEEQMIREFENAYGVIPFANLKH